MKKRLFYIMLAIGVIAAAAILGALCGRLLFDSII